MISLSGGPISGGLTVESPDPSEYPYGNAVMIRGIPVSLTLPQAEEALVYNGASYVPRKILTERVAEYGRISSEFDSLSDAIAAIGGDYTSLILAPGTVYEITADETIPSNITLVGNGGVIKPTTGNNVHLACKIRDTPHQFLDLSGGGSFSLADGALRGNILHSYYVGIYPLGVMLDNYPLVTAASEALQPIRGTLMFAPHERDMSVFYGFEDDSPDLLTGVTYMRGPGWAYWDNFRLEQAAGKFGDRSCFRLGWMHQKHFDLFTFIDLEDVAAGDTVWQTSTASDAAGLTDGMLIGLRSVATSPVSSNGTPGEAMYLQYYRVVGDGDGDTGLFTVHKGADINVGVDLGGAQIFDPNEGVALSTGPDLRTAKITEDVRLIGIAMSSRHEVTVRGCFYNCELDFEVVSNGVDRGSRHLVVANTAAESRITARGAYGNRLIELGFGSHDTYVTVPSAYHSPLAEAEDKEPMIMIGASARRVSVGIGDINAGQHDHKDLIKFGGAGNTVYGLGGQGRIVALHTRDGKAITFGSNQIYQASGDNLVEDLSIFTGYYDPEDLEAPCLRVSVVYGGALGPLNQRDYLRRVKLFGKPKSAAILMTKCEDSIISDCFFEHGRAVAHIGATNNLIRNSHIEGRFTGSGAHQNSMEGNTSPRAVACTGAAIRSGGNVVPIVSTTVGNPVGDGIYAPGALRISDRIPEIIVFEKQFAGESTVRVRISEADGSNPQTVTTLVIPSGTTGFASIEGTFIVKNSTTVVFFAKRILLDEVEQTPVSVSLSVASMDTEGFRITLEGWNTVADTSRLIFHEIDITADIQGFATRGAEKANIVEQVVPGEPTSDVPLLVHHADATLLEEADGATVASWGSLVPWVPETTPWTCVRDENGVNGLPAIRATGTSLLTLNATSVGNTNLFAEAAQKFTVVVVANMTYDGANQTLMSRTNTNTNANKNFHAWLSATVDQGIRMRVRSDNTQEAPITDGTHIHVWTWDGTTFRRYIDSGEPVEVLVGAAALEATAEIRLGGWLTNGSSASPNHLASAGALFCETQIWEGAMEGDYEYMKFETIETLADKFGIEL